MMEELRRLDDDGLKEMAEMICACGVEDEVKEVFWDSILCGGSGYIETDEQHVVKRWMHLVGGIATHHIPHYGALETIITEAVSATSVHDWLPTLTTTRYTSPSLEAALYLTGDYTHLTALRQPLSDETMAHITAHIIENLSTATDIETACRYIAHFKNLNAARVLPVVVGSISQGAPLVQIADAISSLSNNAGTGNDATHQAVSRFATLLRNETSFAEAAAGLPRLPWDSVSCVLPEVLVALRDVGVTHTKVACDMLRSIPFERLSMEAACGVVDVLLASWVYDAKPLDAQRDAMLLVDITHAVTAPCGGMGSRQLAAVCDNLMMLRGSSAAAALCALPLQPEHVGRLVLESAASLEADMGKLYLIRELLQHHAGGLTPHLTDVIEGLLKVWRVMFTRCPYVAAEVIRCLPVEVLPVGDVTAALYDAWCERSDADGNTIRLFVDNMLHEVPDVVRDTITTVLHRLPHEELHGVDFRVSAPFEITPRHLIKPAFDALIATHSDDVIRLPYADLTSSDCNWIVDRLQGNITHAASIACKLPFDHVSQRSQGKLYDILLQCAGCEDAAADAMSKLRLIPPHNVADACRTLLHAEADGDYTTAALLSHLPMEGLTEELVSGVVWRWVELLSSGGVFSVAQCIPLSMLSGGETVRVLRRVLPGDQPGHTMLLQCLPLGGLRGGDVIDALRCVVDVDAEKAVVSRLPLEELTGSAAQDAARLLATLLLDESSVYYGWVGLRKLKGSPLCVVSEEAEKLYGTYNQYATTPGAPSKWLGDILQHIDMSRVSQETSFNILHSCRTIFPALLNLPLQPTSAQPPTRLVDDASPTAQQLLLSITPQEDLVPIAVRLLDNSEKPPPVVFLAGVLSRVGTVPQELTKGITTLLRGKGGEEVVRCVAAHCDMSCLNLFITPGMVTAGLIATFTTRLEGAAPMPLEVFLSVAETGLLTEHCSAAIASAHLTERDVLALRQTPPGRVYLTHAASRLLKEDNNDNHPTLTLMLQHTKVAFWCREDDLPGYHYRVRYNATVFTGVATSRSCMESLESTAAASPRVATPHGVSKYWVPPAHDITEVRGVLSDSIVAAVGVTTHVMSSLGEEVVYKEHRDVFGRHVVTRGGQYSEVRHPYEWRDTRVLLGVFGPDRGAFYVCRSSPGDVVDRNKDATLVFHSELVNSGDATDREAYVEKVRREESVFDDVEVKEEVGDHLDGEYFSYAYRLCASLVEGYTIGGNGERANVTATLHTARSLLLSPGWVSSIKPFPGDLAAAVVFVDQSAPPDAVTTFKRLVKSHGSAPDKFAVALSLQMAKCRQPDTAAPNLISKLQSTHPSGIALKDLDTIAPTAATKLALADVVQCVRHLAAARVKRDVPRQRHRAAAKAACGGAGCVAM